MEIVITRRRRHAAIRISDKALSVSSKDFETAIIHELLHVVMEEMDYEVKLGCDSAHSGTFDRYLESSERAVDHLSKVLYSALAS